ncbi:MAG: hypothetical protein ACRDJY_00295 [Thermoleophilaceae bacterium]
MALDDALTPASPTASGDALDRTTVEDDAGPLYCYRHPKSETYVRCGRCDQPICPKCAVQGPVGFRCRQCGLVKNASIRDFSPRQLALGIGVTFGGGALLGYLGGQIGFFSIFISFFAGSFIAEGAVRFMGLKRGPVMRAIVYGGLLAGFVLGAALQVTTFMNAIPVEAELPVEYWLQSILPYIAIGAGAAIAGAYSRVRWF